MGAALPVDLFLRHILRSAAGICLAASALGASPAHAHPIVSTDVNRHVTLRVTDDWLELRYIYELLEIAAVNTARAWDADGDGKASTDERDAYAHHLSEQLQGAIQVRFDGTRLPLHPDGVRWELGEGAMGLSTWKLYVRLTARLPVHAATGVLEYRDTLRPAEVGWKEIVLSASGATGIARSDVPAHDLSYELTDYAAIAELPNPDRMSANAILRFASGAPPSAPPEPAGGAQAEGARSTHPHSQRSRAAPADAGGPESGTPSARTQARPKPSAQLQPEPVLSLQVPLGSTRSAQPPRAAASFAPSLASAWRHYAWPFFKLGMHHLATGYDHLLFLLGLLLLRQTLGRLVAVVTAFTAAHSVTLVLASAGLVQPPGDWIEPTIAASIAYVGLVALVRPRTAHGPWIALAFGLVHGVGFAGALGGALQGVAGERDWLVALASFNLGIEAFQLLLVVALWPPLQGTDRWSWAPLLRKALALVVLGAGLAWVVARA